MSSLISGHTTSGMDVGLQGGHSTDGINYTWLPPKLTEHDFLVLQEASRMSFQDSRYLTWRDKIQMVCHISDSSEESTSVHLHFYIA